MRIRYILRIVTLTAVLALTMGTTAGCAWFGQDDVSDTTGEPVPAVTTAASVTVTVKAPDAEKQVTVIGGTAAQAVAAAGYDASQYTADVDWNAAVTDGMVITLTERAGDGFVTENDKTYYYQNGERVTDAVVGSDEEGWYYAGADGVIDTGYCDGITYNDEAWNVINGRASRAETDGDMVLHRALQAVAKCTDSSMTKQEKLRAAFDYLKTAYLEGVRHDPPYQEPDWPIVYADDIFVYGKGDCFSYGAAFAYMGKAIGCEECYACNSGGHGWAEIEGLVYDPEWDMHHPEYDHFAVDYDNNATDVNYKGGIAPGAEYMHVAV